MPVNDKNTLSNQYEIKLKQAFREKNYILILKLVSELEDNGIQLHALFPAFRLPKVHQRIVESCAATNVDIADKSNLFPYIFACITTVKNVPEEVSVWLKKNLETLLKLSDDEYFKIKLLMLLNLNLTDIEMLTQNHPQLLLETFQTVIDKDNPKYNELASLIIKGFVINKPETFIHQFRCSTERFNHNFIVVLLRWLQQNPGNEEVILHHYLGQAHDILPYSPALLYRILLNTYQQKKNQEILHAFFPAFWDCYVNDDEFYDQAKENESIVCWIKRCLFEHGLARNLTISLRHLILFCHEQNDFDGLLKTIELRQLTASHSLLDIIEIIRDRRYEKFYRPIITTPLFVNVMNARVLIELAITCDDEYVMHSILLEDKAGGRDVVLAKLSREATMSNTMFGLLYAYSQGKLPPRSDFDFLLLNYYSYCYDYWRTHRDETFEIRDVSHSDSESAMHVGNTLAIPMQAQRDGITIDINNPLDNLLQYISEQLQHLQGNRRALENLDSRQKFIPDIQADSANPVDKNGRIMSSKSQQIARLHTVLRLLLRDFHEGYDPYFHNIDDIIAYCFEYAKRSQCLDSFITALVDIRRGHNEDLVRGHAVYAKQLPDRCSCSPGSQGRLYQFFVLSQRAIADNTDSNEVALKPFNPHLLWDDSHSFVRQQLQLMVRNFTGGDQHHLARICLYLQFIIATQGVELDEDEKLEKQQLRKRVESALHYLVERKLDISSHVLSLLKTFNPQISISSVQLSRMKELLKGQLKVLFALDEEKTADNSLVTRYHYTLFKQIYPHLLAHYLYVDSGNNELNFSKLAEFADLISSEINNDVYQQVAQRSAELLEYYTVHNRQLHIDDLFSKLKMLPKSVMPDGLFNKHVVSIAKRVLAQFELSTFLSLLINVTTYKSKLADELMNLFQSQLKVFLVNSLNERHGEGLAVIKKIMHLCNEIDADELTQSFHQLSTHLLSAGKISAYLQLCRFGECFNLQLAAPRESQLSVWREDAQKKHNSVGGKNPFRRAPKDSHVNAFISLKQTAAMGNPYASFVLAQLYRSGRAINTETTGRVSDNNLANLYSLIAYNQAQQLNQRQTQITIQAWRQRYRFDDESLHVTYYDIMDKALTYEGEIGDLIDQLVLIATHVDYLSFIQVDVSCNSKDSFCAVENRILTGENLEHSDNLIAIYQALANAGCKLMSQDGSILPQDPAERLREVQFQKDLQQVVTPLKRYGDSSFTVERLLDDMKLSLGLNQSGLSTLLFRVYSHMTSSRLSFNSPGSFHRERIMLETIIENCHLNLRLTAQEQPKEKTKIKQRATRVIDIQQPQIHSITDYSSKSPLVIEAIEAVANNGLFTSDDVLINLQSLYNVDNVTARLWVAQTYHNSQASSTSAAIADVGFFRSIKDTVSIERQLQGIVQMRGLRQYNLVSSSEVPHSYNC